MKALIILLAINACLLFLYLVSWIIDWVRAKQIERKLKQEIEELSDELVKVEREE